MAARRTVDSPPAADATSRLAARNAPTSESPRLFALSLDRHAAAHLMAALRQHIKTTRYPVPEALHSLLQTTYDTFEPTVSRQEPPAADNLERSESSTSTVEWMTVPEVAKALSMSARSVERRVASGEIPSRKFGRSRRIPRAAIAVLAEPRGVVAR